MSGFEVAKQKNHCELKFTAEISKLASDDADSSVQQITRQLKESGAKQVLIDLSTFESLPDGFVAFLLRLRREFDGHDFKSAVVAAGTTKEQLHQSGLESMWQTAASRTEGLNSLGISAADDSGPLGTTDSRDEMSAAPPFLFEDQRGYCSVQFNPVLMSMSWADVEAATSEVIEKIKASNNNSVMVDLAPMPIINSGLVASLVRIWKAMQVQKGHFSLVSPNELVTDVLKSAGLWKLWTVVEEREEAVYELGAGEVAMVEKRERRLLMLVSVPCALIAVFALLLTYSNTAGKWGANTYLSALLLASASLTTGLLSILKDKGFRRIFSALAVLTSIGVLSSLAFDKNPLALLGKATNQQDSEEDDTNKRIVIGPGPSTDDTPETPIEETSTGEATETDDEPAGNLPQESELPGDPEPTEKKSSTGSAPLDDAATPELNRSGDDGAGKPGGESSTAPSETELKTDLNSDSSR